MAQDAANIHLSRVYNNQQMKKIICKRPFSLLHNYISQCFRQNKRETERKGQTRDTEMLGIWAEEEKNDEELMLDEGALDTRQEMSWSVSYPRTERGAKNTAAFPLCPHLSLYSSYDPFPAASCSLA